MPDQGVSRLTGVISTDPLVGQSLGTVIRAGTVVHGGSNADVVPEGVSNWDFYQGALLAIGVRTSTVSFGFLGTGVMIAPGLALTATHVLAFRPNHLPALQSGDASMLCIGVRSEGLDVWKLRSIAHKYHDDEDLYLDDLAYLSLELASPLTEGWRFSSLPITTRCPTDREELTIVGFRFCDEQIEASDARVSAGGDLFAAKGLVTAVYPRGRDNVLYPTINISCGSLGGMSGGAVLDSEGKVMGLISRGYDGGPTYAAWVVGALDRQLDIPWPPGSYPNPVDVMDIPEEILHVTGREAVSKAGYQIWYAS